MTNSAWTETEFQFGPVSTEIVERANISLNKFSSMLEDLGIIVHRPLDRDYAALNQFYGDCPRD
jgi:hypothetical protein